MKFSILIVTMIKKAERTMKRSQITAIYEDEGDWKEKALELNVPLSTA